MQEIVDAGGFRITLHQDGGRLIMSGWGPRGAERGQVVLAADTLPELLDELDELAGGGPGSGHLPARPLTKSLSYCRVPVVPSAPHRQGNPSLLYLMGRNGGDRPPVRIYDRETFRQLARATEKILSAN